MIRKGDQVLVIAGNDKGKEGQVLTRKEDRVVVQGINIRKKHLRRNQQTQGGRVIEMEMPIHISNIRLSKKEEKKKAERVEPKEAPKTVKRQARKPKAAKAEKE